jgi:hypothetical protein
MKYLLILALIACTPPPKKVNPAILLLIQPPQQELKPIIVTNENGIQYCARCYNETGFPLKDGEAVTKQ